MTDCICCSGLPYDEPRRTSEEDLYLLSYLDSTDEEVKEEWERVQRESCGLCEHTEYPCSCDEQETKDYHTMMLEYRAKQKAHSSTETKYYEECKAKTF